MKKYLLMIAVVAAMASCNSKNEEKNCNEKSCEKQEQQSLHDPNAVIDDKAEGTQGTEGTEGETEVIETEGVAEV